eukprot:scaffold32866_cov177-Skeletonema_menzelii.AAC.1
MKQSLIFLLVLVLGSSAVAQTVDVTSQIATSSAAQMDVDAAIRTNKSIVKSTASQAFDATSRRNNCFAECRQMLKEEIFRTTMCAPAVNVHPIPGAFQACKDGERTSFKQACTARCTASIETVPFEKSSSFHACAKHKKGLREKFNWCRRGYDANRERLSTVISSNIVEDGSVEELVEAKSALNHHDVSRALVQVQEVDKAVERLPDTLQVARQSKGIEVGSTVTEQEAELRLFDSHRTPLEVLSSQEKHVLISFEAIPHFMAVRSEVSSSLFDMLPNQVPDLDTPMPTSSAAPNPDILYAYSFVLHSWTDQFFLATFITAEIDEPFSTASAAVGCPGFYTGSSCNVHDTRSKGSKLDIFFLPFKDNFAVWSDESTLSPCFEFIEWYTAQVLVVVNQDNLLQAVERLNESNIECTSTNVTSRKIAYEYMLLQMSLNYEGFGSDATLHIWSLVDYLSLESSGITVRLDLSKIYLRQLSFRKLLHHFWSTQVPFKEEDDQHRSELVFHSPIQGQGILIISVGTLYQRIHFPDTSRDYRCQLEDITLYTCTLTNADDPNLVPAPDKRNSDKCSLPSRSDAISLTTVNCSVESRSNQVLLTKSRLRLCRWKHLGWTKLKLKELNAPSKTAAKPSTIASEAFLVLVRLKSIKGYEWSTFPIVYSFQSLDDHLECQCNRFKYRLDRLESSSTSKAPDVDVDTDIAEVAASLQLSYGVASHVWPIHTRTRLKSADSLRLVYLNISSEYVPCLAGSGIISHLERDVNQATRSFGTMATIATVFMVLYFYHRSGGRIRQIESLAINQRVIQSATKITPLDTDGEGREDGSSDRKEALVIEWRLQWWHELLNIDPLLDSMGFCWKDKRRKLQLATKALACSSAAVRWKCGT